MVKSCYKRQEKIKDNPPAGGEKDKGQKKKDKGRKTIRRLAEKKMIRRLAEMTKDLRKCCGVSAG